MKGRWEFDNTTKTVWRGEIDIKDASFKIPPKVWPRLIWHTVIMLALPFAALAFDQLPMFWFALVFGLVVLGIEIFIYGFFGDVFSRPELTPVSIYGKRYLLLQACFWTLLIGGCALALYLKARAS